MVGKMMLPIGCCKLQLQKKTGPYSIARSSRQIPSEEHELPHEEHVVSHDHGDAHNSHFHEMQHDEEQQDLKGFARCSEGEVGHVSRCHMLDGVKSNSQEHCLEMAAQHNGDTFNFRPDNGKCLIVNCEGPDLKMMPRGADPKHFWHVYSKWCPGGEAVHELEMEEKEEEDEEEDERIKELVAKQEAERFEELAKEAWARYEAAKEAEKEDEKEIEEVEEEIEEAPE